MACTLCQSDRFELVSERDAKSGKPLPVSLCLDCGLIQQTPMPTLEELRVYYETEYRLDYKKTYSPKPKHILRAGKKALGRIDFLQNAPSHPQGSLLDIGAGGGEFLYLCTQRGIPDVRGIEPNQGYCEHARQELGVSIEQQRWQDLDQVYDIITMFHVFEHLQSPREVFQKLYQLVRPGGWLLIEVPWHDTAAQSPSNIYFKAHTLYFTAETLSACGSEFFEPEMVETFDSNLRMLFRPRPAPTSLQLPGSEKVQQIRSRLQQKGWLEYLTSGGGLFKPLEKSVQIFTEEKVKHMTGQAILNQLNHKSKAA